MKVSELAQLLSEFPLDANVSLSGDGLTWPMEFLWLSAGGEVVFAGSGEGPFDPIHRPASQEDKEGLWSAPFAEAEDKPFEHIDIPLKDRILR